MTQEDIITPIATVDTRQCMITSPWFVQNTEYSPMPATYKPLVNGEEAFAAVYHAIMNAQKTVDIICWGFQPSMYFIRDGQSLCIGELLCKIAETKKVQVRILGWEMPCNAAGVGGEANLPGKGVIRYKDRKGQSTTDERYAYDRQWFSQYSLSGEWSDHQLKKGQAGIAEIAAAPIAQRQEKLSSLSPLFVGRGFNFLERAEIAYRAANMALDPDISPDTMLTLAGTVTHHQKTVLVDYELPESAVGFVMGHNMLDEYWDTDKHSALFRPGNNMDPRLGANGKLPRQDISSRVTGPILEHLHHNFAMAWEKETGQDLLTIRDSVSIAKKLKLRALVKVLAKYSWAQPVVPEINDIVPLPPAPLPEWDGKLKWLEEREANIPPPAPDATLIEKLAKAKQLNPATGRPLPTSPDFEKDSVARLQCRSGEPCPQSGYWQPAWRPREGMSEHAIRYFREGDIMPVEKVTFVRPRPWPLRDRLVVEEQETVWRRVGEA
ncbi:DUF6396 domain-containing protein [Klebsiella pneumoniae]|uniref:DUF6396 domain-containing protein n=4 Tax=Klebsiella pneumoniae TaxID=573 RepID=UPI001FAD7F3A|nr:DUF6396 domain-containing protein [Klebsiella pneumoniae]